MLLLAAGIGLSLVSATFTAGIFVYIKGIDFEETPMSTFVVWFFTVMGSVALPFTLAMDNWYTLCPLVLSLGRTFKINIHWTAPLVPAAARVDVLARRAHSVPST